MPAGLPVLAGDDRHGIAEWNFAKPRNRKVSIMSFVESSLGRLAIAMAVAIVTVGVVIVEPVQAQAPRPNGYPVTNVNLRAGPGTYYPALLVVPSRALTHSAAPLMTASRTA